MMNLDKILEEPHHVKLSEIKRILRENDYEKEAVENWLYVNGVKAVREKVNLFREHESNIISDEEFWKIRKINLMKCDIIISVFRAYKEVFNVRNALFKDFFDSEINT